MDVILIVDCEALLVKRKHEPFQGKWAIPGGFVEDNERVIAAAQREMQEETGVSLTNLKQFGAYGDPGRDPRGRTVSVVYWCRLAAKPAARAADDAADCGWFRLDQLPEMAFDHALILNDVLQRLNELE